jgi:hypothetical protein
MRSNGLRAPSPLPESLKPPFVHGERTESAFFNFTKGEQTDKATRALHRMALSETVPLKALQRFCLGAHSARTTQSVEHALELPTAQTRFIKPRPWLLSTARP